MKLEVKNLQYSIDNNIILQNISLHVKEKQFVGLIGPNGSGKTTLLRNVYRIIKPDAGELMLDEQDLSKLSTRETAKRMAVLRQEMETEFDYTVEEIVAMGRFSHHRLLDPDTEEDKQIVEKCLNRVGMLHKRDSYLSVLSGGEKQRVLIARALAQESDFLVLDEPTNHLDIFYKMQILSLIRSLDVTVISAIHDLDLACKYCDYLYVIEKGNIVGHGSPAEIITPDLMKRVFHVYADIHVGSKREDMNINYLSPVQL